MYFWIELGFLDDLVLKFASFSDNVSIDYVLTGL